MLSDKFFGIGLPNLNWCILLTTDAALTVGSGQTKFSCPLYFWTSSSNQPIPEIKFWTFLTYILPLTMFKVHKRACLSRLLMRVYNSSVCAIPCWMTDRDKIESILTWMLVTSNSADDFVRFNKSNETSILFSNLSSCVNNNTNRSHLVTLCSAVCSFTEVEENPILE